MFIVNNVSGFLQNSLALLIYVYYLPALRLSNVPINRYQLLKQYQNVIYKNGFPFILIGSFIFILAIVLTILVY